MWRALATTVLGLGLVACGSDADSGPPVKEPVKSATVLRGSPAPLRKLHAQANDLLGGGATAFERRLKELKGYPIVVNKWASWCGPCRAEFPFFARQALKRGKDVAFLGVNSNDSDTDAKGFLGSFPVSYPSYKDPDLEVAATFKAVQAFPSTAFYDSKGELAYVKQGGYSSERKLAEDIARYAR